MKNQQISVTPFQKKVYDVVSKIPKGKIMTYSEVARAIGKSNAYRAVGNALNKNPHPYPPKFSSRKLRLGISDQVSSLIPCHRVVRSDGTVGGFASGTRKKIQLLQKEGVIK